MGQEMAKYNSHQARKTNFPSALPYSLTGIFRPRKLGCNLNVRDFIHIILGVCSPKGVILNVMSHLHCQR